MVPEIKRIDFRTLRLEGRSGKQYWVLKDMAAIRYTQFLAFQPTITKGASYQEWAAANNKIYELLTSGNNVMGNIHEAATIALNMNSIFKDFDEHRYHAILYFCMLFIVGEDEDPGIWDTRIAQKNIEDLDHYSMQDFFFLALNVLKDWSLDYQRITGKDPIGQVPEKSAKEILSHSTGTT